MTFDEAIVHVRREHARLERKYLEANRARRPGDWMVLVARRFGNLAQAVVGGSPGWVAEETVKLAATAVAWLALQPEEAAARIGREGVIEVDRVGGPFPRLAAKSAEPPPESKIVATGVDRIWIGGGHVWAESKKEEIT